MCRTRSPTSSTEPSSEDKPAFKGTDNSTMSNGNDTGLLTDDFLINYYKVVPCKRKYAHDWASCPCSHKGERAARRSPADHIYAPIACNYAKQRMDCPMGNKCSNAHNMFEYWLHPQRFQTELCQFGANCNRSVCFFAHSVADLKPLDPSLPPTEACWATGALLNRGRRHQQQQAQQQRQVQAHAQQMLGFAPGSQAVCYPGQQPSLDSAAMNGVPPGMLAPHQQQVPMVVMTSMPAPGAPSSPGLIPTVQHAHHSPQQPQQPQPHYTQQQTQPQQQMVLLQSGPGTSSSAMSGAYAAMPSPVSNGGLPVMSVVSAGGVQGGTMVFQAQQLQQPQPPPQHALQYSMMPSSNQQVMQYSMPGSNQPTYWVQVQDPSTVSTASAQHMPAGQICPVQVELPAGQMAPGSSIFPAQACSYTVLDGGYILQQQQQQPAQGVLMQQQQQQPAQGVLMQQQQQQPAQGVLMQPMQGYGLHGSAQHNPAGNSCMVQVGVLDPTACAGMGVAGGPMLQQQQPGSTDSWQYVYQAGSHGAHNVLIDLQAMNLN